MAEVTQAAIEAAVPKRGESVVDIGCGTGTTVLRLAEAVGPTGKVLGVDISEQQLRLARQRIAAADVTQVQLCLMMQLPTAFRPRAST
jgi:ubiquinone/menaquinone biosynthesis C-methylase UbiE